MVAVRGGDGALWTQEVHSYDTIDGIHPQGWQYSGGYLAEGSTPDIKNYWDDWATFVRGGDGGLWCNKNNAWSSLGGYITSDPEAIYYSSGSIAYPKEKYIFARGGDGALWYNHYNSETGASAWSSLGGYISPAGTEITGYKAKPGIQEESLGNFHAFVRGGDGALWDNILDPTSTQSNWYGLGGYIVSDPSVRWIDGKLWAGVIGSDGNLWMNKMG